MRINADLIVRLRVQRAWSQDELAIATALNLRTIQRIENEATASLQSVKALASVFDVSIGDIQLRETVMIGELVGRNVTIVMGISTGMAASVSAFKDEVKGRIIQIDGSWLKLAEKSKTMYVNTTLIKRIIPD